MNISTLFQFFNRHRKKPPIQKFDGNLYNLSTQTVHRHQKQHLIADRNFLSQNSWLPFNSEKKKTLLAVCLLLCFLSVSYNRDEAFSLPPFWLSPSILTREASSALPLQHTGTYHAFTKGEQTACYIFAMRMRPVNLNSYWEHALEISTGGSTAHALRRSLSG